MARPAPPSVPESMPAPPRAGGWLARLREPGWALSGLAHGGLLVAALVAFSRTPPLPDADEAIPVEVVDANALRSVTQGERTAQAVVENPRPRIDRVAETNETSPRPGEAKRDVPTPPARAPEPAPEAASTPPAPQPQAAAEATPPPPAEPAPEPPLPPRRPAAEAPTPPVPEPPRREQAAVTPARPAPTPPAREEAEEAAAPPRRVEPPKPEPPKPEPPKAELAKPQPPRPERRPEPPRPDPAEIARLLERTAPKPTPTPAPKPTPAPPTTATAPAARPPARERGDTAFNPNDIARLLQSRETPQAAASTGAAPQRTAALGSTTGRAAKLSLSDRDALLGTLREQLRNCWNPLPGSEGVVPRVRVQLSLDGSLTAQPAVVNSSSDPRFQAAADGALRAVRRCAPFRNLGRFAPFHDDWRTLVVDFNPAELL